MPPDVIVNSAAPRWNPSIQPRSVASAMLSRAKSSVNNNRCTQYALKADILRSFFVVDSKATRPSLLGLNRRNGEIRVLLRTAISMCPRGVLRDGGLQFKNELLNCRDRIRAAVGERKRDDGWTSQQAPPGPAAAS